MSDPTVYAWDRERGDYVSDAGVRCSAPRVVGLDDYAILRAEVERQRQLIEDIDASGIHSCHDHCQRLECAQRREIERLRAEVTESRRCETEPYQVSEWLQREHDKLRTRLAEARAECAENATLRARLAEAERDAVRYRWLRDRAWPFEFNGDTPADADAAIDAAMRPPAKNHTPRCSYWDGLFAQVCNCGAADNERA